MLWQKANISALSTWSVGIGGYHWILIPRRSLHLLHILDRGSGKSYRLGTRHFPAPASFQRLMERVLLGIHWKSLLLYLDDIIIIAPYFQTHLQQLEEMFQRLNQAGLKPKPTKCKLLHRGMKYLGRVGSRQELLQTPRR